MDGIYTLYFSEEDPKSLPRSPGIFERTRHAGSNQISILGKSNLNTRIATSKTINLGALGPNQNQQTLDNVKRHILCLRCSKEGRSSRSIPCTLRPACRNTEITVISKVAVSE